MPFKIAIRSCFPAHSGQSRGGNLKKKTRTWPRQRSRKKRKKHALDQEKKKKLSFFLITFMVEFLFFFIFFLFTYFLVFFYKFPPQGRGRNSAKNTPTNAAYNEGPGKSEKKLAKLSGKFECFCNITSLNSFDGRRGSNLMYHLKILTIRKWSKEW